jgi:hypothetical protein
MKGWTWWDGLRLGSAIVFATTALILALWLPISLVIGLFRVTSLRLPVPEDVGVLTILFYLAGAVVLFLAGRRVCRYCDRVIEARLAQRTSLAQTEASE